MTRFVQVVPRNRFRLYGAMVQKEIELRGRGTFRRAGPKARNRARWSHVRYKGSITIRRMAGEVVAAQVRPAAKGGRGWQLLHAFIGWLDRHFGDHIESLTIQYGK